ncbi:MAG TPA: PilZ domain-containing protein [Candidatus Dormibacteraeota bacterium]|nr:PilZ domain-containing protein [Candidatus Dormibacteraeota bacterium]
MSATRRAISAEDWPCKSAAGPLETAKAPQVAATRPQTSPTGTLVVTSPQSAPAAQPAVTELPRTPALRVVPLLRSSLPRQFVRVPTHAVGLHPEQRQYPRAKLKLPLRLRAVGGVPEQYPITLVMRNISSTGVYFLSPKHLAVGTRIELEVVLVSKPMGRGSVVMTTVAHVCRTEAAAMPGWYGLAASFDDVQFDHDDDVPSRFLRP